ncbi:MAG TPA: hypothetical protein VI643_04745 [Planctomycetota bacterium]|nr:hypothetical protein [Planctomycetota bacterium]
MLGKIWSALSFFFSPDPVMRKEMLGASRHWQTYFLRAFYVGILGFVVWAAWGGSRNYGEVTISDLARMGRDLFDAFVWTQLVLVLLGAVVLASDMIGKEVRQKTLGIALLTPLGPGRIVMGKWKSCMGYLTLFVLSGVPILSVAVYLGGVAWGTLLEVTALTISAAVVCSAISIFISCWTRGVYSAFVMSCLGLIAYGGLPILVFMLVFFWMYGLDSPGRGWEAVMLYNPSLVMANTLYGLRGGPNIGVDHAWLWCSLIQVGVAGIALWLAARRTAKLGLLEPKPPALRRVFESMDRFLARINPWGITFGGRRRGPYDGNPLLWKELNFRMTGRLRYLTRIVLGLLLVSAIVIRLAGMSIIDDEFYLGAIAVTGILLLLAAIGAGSGAFTKEKEEGKWDILLTTPMRAPHFVFGKLAGAMTTIAPALVVFLVSCSLPVVASMGHGASTYYIIPFLLVCGTFLVFVVMSGMFFSLWLPNSRGSFGLCLLVVIFLLALLPLMTVILSEALDVIDREPAEGLIYITNPAIHFELVFSMRRYWGEPDSLDYAPGFVFIYLAASAGFLWAMLAKFDHLAKRAR